MRLWPWFLIYFFNHALLKLQVVKEHYLTTLHVFWSSSPNFWDPSDKAPNHSIFLSSGPATNSPGIGSRIAVLNPKDSNFPIPFPLGHICCWAATAYVYCIHFQINKKTVSELCHTKNFFKHLSKSMPHKNSCDTYLFLISLLQRNAFWTFWTYPAWEFQTLTPIDTNIPNVGDKLRHFSNGSWVWLPISLHPNQICSLPTIHRHWITWWMSLWLHHKSQKKLVLAAFKVILNS